MRLMMTILWYVNVFVETINAFGTKIIGHRVVEGTSLHDTPTGFFTMYCRLRNREYAKITEINTIA